MKIKVLQGVNLLNPITTIIGEFDGTPSESIIKDIQNIHEIVMYDYRIEGNKVAVVSKLPHLWKEIFKVLNQLAKGEESEKATRTYLWDVIIKRQLGSMSGIPTIMAAQKGNYEITQFLVDEGIPMLHGTLGWNRHYAIGVGQEIEMFKQVSTSKDSKDAKSFQRDKYVTNSLVSRLNLPIAKWMIIEDADQLKKEFENFPKPFVIKPAGLTQGAGVVTKIDTIEKALAGYKKAYDAIHGNKSRAKWQHKIMIQQQVQGDDYRILVIDGRFRIATKRIPAYVTGDGNSTVEELVTVSNQDPRRNPSDPTHILKPIVIDDMMHDYLTEQELSLSHVPAKDERIYVRKIASMSRGGMTEDVTEMVHPQIRLYAETLAKTSKAFVMGIDVMCVDITKPLTIENGSFIEMNTMPEAFLNAFPTDGTQYPQIGEWIIEGLTKDKEPTSRIVAIGGTVDDVRENIFELNLVHKDETYGIQSNGAIYIKNQLMSKGNEVWKAIEATKLNASLSTVILHYPRESDVMEMGFGFDIVDTVLIMDEVKYTDKIDALIESGQIGESVDID